MSRVLPLPRQKSSSRYFGWWLVPSQVALLQAVRLPITCLALIWHTQLVGRHQELPAFDNEGTL
jgi:hypothetical protein